MEYNEIITEEILKEINKDPYKIAEIITENTRKKQGNIAPILAHDYLRIMEVATLALSLIKSGKISTPLPVLPIPTGNFANDYSQVRDILISLRTTIHKIKEQNSIKILLDKIKNRFEIEIENTFHYEFSEGDIKHIQATINTLRELISNSTKLEQDHRERLLKRLEQLQSEVHKKISDLDRFWGLIGDAGVVLGKIGTDAKPIVDRIRELAEIVWRTQARTEELPSDAPFPRLTSKN